MRFFIKNIANRLVTLTALSQKQANRVSGGSLGPKVKDPKLESDSAAPSKKSSLSADSVNQVVGGSGGNKVAEPKVKCEPIAQSSDYKFQLEKSSTTRVVGGSSGTKGDDPRLEKPDSGGSN
ncbi:MULTISPECIES: hypothetical protein [Pseudoalteromonas]|uniref:hypothetical protein n=1 Tax=Pseudoalteromonas TaxID=53246 RepID=UPI000B054F93|nr:MULTISPECIES: hypothetical protein [Pseudoalteromonas]